MAARGLLSKLLSRSQLGLARPCSPAWPAGLQQLREIHGTGRKKRPGGGGYMRTGALPGAPRPPRFLVTGACGQVGMELVPFLRARFGGDEVIASDIKTSSREFVDAGPFVYADVQDSDSLARIVLEHGVDYIVHLASLLSAIGERNPQLALKINTNGIQNVLELARLHSLQVFAPSTIAVFGPSTPRDLTPNTTVMEPTTMYGITKVHLELLGKYYARVYGVDFRSIRYPGVISSKAMPGGGTTDYAVEIFHDALRHGTYRCFLDEKQVLPMMYMPDCLEATVNLMMAPREKLTQAVYNVTGMSFTPSDLAAAIRKRRPDFRIVYEPDFRQAIATTWPRTIDDSLARKDWGWQNKYDIDSMTIDMFEQLQGRYVIGAAR
ncbi:NAD-dependent epimerase/dehydratase [Klebsormidium nitens]|uniref:L-threonine 3-dehydrogenase, mitochondrial n=1 Tax=Klebsormidium nitens TaxID=105231 RepID=A0A0U9HSD7_KLENI|nr:NAD-dependent epimerase/dehydratase [Klebsormidium nitens]|eukprot:GAQ88885.1 NAD-dependent epimerase/dehydratase [Klebsormidium nitens]